MSKGNQNPTYSWVTEYTKTEGRFASQLSSAYDLTPHPWQDLVLDDWLAVDNNGILINNYCILLVSRQNGKTGVSDPRETWGLVKRGESILHTAQEYQTAKKAFDRLRKKFGERKNDPYARFPELNAMVDHYTTSANQMVLDLTNGAHIEFRTRGNSSDMGRGGTFDVVVIDEAQSYTEAQAAALSPLNSASPLGSPQTILMGTPPTPEALHKGYIFSNSIHEIHENPTKGSCLHEWSVKEVGDVRDKKRWYFCNPSLGYQLLESALEKDLKGMSDDTFAREHLGYIAPRALNQVNYAIPKELWDSCKSDEQIGEGKIAYGIKFSADGSEVCLAGAVMSSKGITRVEMIDRRSTSSGTRWLADWLNQRYEKASCVVIDGKNGVEVLTDRIVDTWKAKGSIVRPTAKEVVAAASLVTDGLTEKTLTWYSKQEALRESAVNSVKRSINGGWGFGGENSAPIEAVALALYGVKTSKRTPGKHMRIG